jgi:hypothetical protein
MLAGQSLRVTSTRANPRSRSGRRPAQKGDHIFLVVTGNFEQASAIEKSAHVLVTPHLRGDLIENDLSPWILQVSEVRIANITTSVQHVFRQLALDVEKLIELAIKC